MAEAETSISFIHNVTTILWKKERAGVSTVDPPADLAAADVTKLGLN